MTANVFRQSFATKSDNAVALSKALEGLRHNALKGQLREILLSQLFEPFLPPDVRVVSGSIVSFDGAQSPQIDAVIYAPSILPAFLLEKTGLVPVEAALYAIEVKSRLTATQLRKSIRNAQTLGAMRTLAARHIFPCRKPGKLFREVYTTMPLPIRALIAFDSDLKGPPEKEIDRYRKYEPNTGQTPAIAVLCIVGRGYWTAGTDGLWTQIAVGNEALGFLAGMTNTIPQLITTKGKPNFGHYLVEGNPTLPPI